MAELQDFIDSAEQGFLAVAARRNLDYAELIGLANGAEFKADSALTLADSVSSIALAAATDADNALAVANAIEGSKLNKMRQRLGASIVEVNAILDVLPAFGFEYGIVGEGANLATGGSGTAIDDGQSVQDWLNSIANAGGGQALVNFTAYVNRTINVPKGVSLVTNISDGQVVGMEAGPGARPGTFVLGPLGQFVYTDGCASLGVNYISVGGAKRPTSTADAIAKMATWAGYKTACALDGANIVFKNNLIIGFPVAVQNFGGNKSIITENSIHCYNGIILERSHDTSRVRDNQIWPFYVPLIMHAYGSELTIPGRGIIIGSLDYSETAGNRNDGPMISGNLVFGSDDANIDIINTYAAQIYDNWSDNITWNWGEGVGKRSTIGIRTAGRVRLCKITNNHADAAWISFNLGHDAPLGGPTESFAAASVLFAMNTAGVAGKYKLVLGKGAGVVDHFLSASSDGNHQYVVPVGGQSAFISNGIQVLGPQTQVYVNGVLKTETTHYTRSGATITFVTPLLWKDVVNIVPHTMSAIIGVVPGQDGRIDSVTGGGWVLDNVDIGDAGPNIPLIECDPLDKPWIDVGRVTPRYSASFDPINWTSYVEARPASNIPVAAGQFVKLTFSNKTVDTYSEMDVTGSFTAKLKGLYSFNLVVNGVQAGSGLYALDVYRTPAGGSPIKIDRLKHVVVTDFGDSVVIPVRMEKGDKFHAEVYLAAGGSVTAGATSIKTVALHLQRNYN